MPTQILGDTIQLQPFCICQADETQFHTKPRQPDKSLTACLWHAEHEIIIPFVFMVFYSD